MKNLVLVYIVVLVDAVSPTTTGESRWCTRNVTRHREASRIQTYTQTIRERKPCGVFGWSRCTTYRDTVAYTTVTYMHPYVVQETICCDGWTNANRSVPGTAPCSTHTQPPQVVYCEKDTYIPGAHHPLESSFVSWQQPRFAEPFEFALRVQESVSTPQYWTWGTYRVTYTATSTNNNLTASCTMNIHVTPPSSEPQIYDLVNNSRFTYPEGHLLHLSCYSAYSPYTSAMFWKLNNSQHLPNDFEVSFSNASVRLGETTYRSFESFLSVAHTPATLDGLSLECSVRHSESGQQTLRLWLQSTPSYQPTEKSPLQLPFPAWVIAPMIGGAMLLVFLLWLVLMSKYPGCCSCQNLRRCKCPDCKPFLDMLLNPGQQDDEPISSEPNEYNLSMYKGVKITHIDSL